MWVLTGLICQRVIDHGLTWLLGAWSRCGVIASDHVLSVAERHELLRYLLLVMLSLYACNCESLLMTGIICVVLAGLSCQYLLQAGFSAIEEDLTDLDASDFVLFNIKRSASVQRMCSVSFLDRWREVDRLKVTIRRLRHLMIILGSSCELWIQILLWFTKVNVDGTAIDLENGLWLPYDRDWYIYVQWVELIGRGLQIDHLVRLCMVDLCL